MSNISVIEPNKANGDAAALEKNELLDRIKLEGDAQEPDNLTLIVDEDRDGLGCWQSFRFFMKHSFKDIGRHKCHFCLSFCSVLIVVLSTLVVNTVIAKGPIIFLSLAQ